MKKKIFILSLSWLTVTSSIQACLFSVLNDSPYEEIYLSTKKHLAHIVNREILKEALIESRTSPSKKKNKTINTTEKVVRVTKVMKKNHRGQIASTWFDIYIPYYENEKSRRASKKIASQFRKAYRVSARSCSQDSDIDYSKVARGYATQAEKKRKENGETQLFDIIDFSKSDQAAIAHELIARHEQTMMQEAKKKKDKKRKKRAFVDQFKNEQLEPSKRLSKEDKEFYQDTTYPGGDENKFEEILP